MEWDLARSILAKHHDSKLIPSLIAILSETDSDWSLRIKAAEALGALQSQEAVPTLIDALEGDDEWVAIAAAEALGKIKDVRAVPSLIKGLQSEASVRLISEIQKRNDPKEALPAVQYVSDLTELRSRAAEALGQIASDEALEALAAALYDDNYIWRGVQFTVVRVLQQMNTEKARNFLNEWEQHTSDSN